MTPIKLNFVHLGDPGLPILLLHGLNESLESFRPHLDPLSKNATVYAVDLRGHGQTNWEGNCLGRGNIFRISAITGNS